MKVFDEEILTVENSDLRAKLSGYLADFVTVQRLERIRQVLENRTRHVTVVVEDLYQTQNISAVLRTCECYGVQDVHVIEHENEFQIHNAISMGASKWLSVNQYRSENSIADCVGELREKGYQLVATLPAEESLFLDQLPVDKPTAFLFGTELHGLSPELVQQADKTIKIPMYGFTESFNISNSVAITLSHFVEKMRQAEVKWQLTETEKEELYFAWLQKSIKKSKLLIENFLK